MKVEKIAFYDLVCPNCGSKIRVSADEYKKYREETADYGNTILCTEYDDENKNGYEINYVNFNCPVCRRYIPVTVADGDNDYCDADRFGFKVSNNVKPFYGITEDVDIDKYIQHSLGLDEEEENE